MSNLLRSIARFLNVSLAVWAIFTNCADYAVCAEEAAIEAADSDWEPGLAQDCEATCWTARAGVIAWERGRPRGASLVSDAATLTSVLDAANFDFGYKPGFEVALQRQGVGCWDLELRYLQNDAWDSRVSTVSPNLVQIDHVSPTFVGADGPVTIDATYQSALHNGELNLRRTNCSGLTLLVGFRYVGLDERLGMVFTDPGLVAPVRNDFATHNDLYGCQLGFEKTRCLTDRLELGCGVKGGLFWNHATQASVLDYGLFADSLSAKTDAASLLGEATVSLNYQLSPALSLCGDYRVLSVSQVALASGQVGASDFVNLTASVNRGDVFYHGAFLGFEYRR